MNSGKVLYTQTIIKNTRKYVLSLSYILYVNMRRARTVMRENHSVHKNKYYMVKTIETIKNNTNNTVMLLVKSLSGLVYKHSR